MGNTLLASAVNDFNINLMVGAHGWGAIIIVAAVIVAIVASFLFWLGS